MVSPLVAALLVAGLGYCLTRLRSTRLFAMVAWLVLTLVLGGILTYDPPYWPHLNIALPAVAIIAALAADQLIAAWSPADGGPGRPALVAGFGVILSLTALANWQVYYDFARDNAGPKNAVSRYIRALPPGYHVYLLSSAFTWNEFTFQFYNEGVPGATVTTDGLRTSPPPAHEPAVFVLYDTLESLHHLQTHYPGGWLQWHFPGDGRWSFATYAYVPDGFQPVATNDSFNIFTLPGWWLIGGALALVASRAGYLSWKGARPGQAVESPVALI
jgi:hypothetical protein